jgi:hypothetical protein
MSEKVIHEVRVVETEDGFRIEIKGDKERLRAMGLGEGSFPFGFGRMGHGPFSHHGPRGFGFHGGRHHGHGPWGRWGQNSWWSDEPETQGNRETPTADKV